MIEQRICQLLIFVIFFSSLVPLFYGCTLSFTNVSTHGNASDLIDEEQTTSPDIKSDLSIPTGF